MPISNRNEFPICSFDGFISKQNVKMKLCLISASKQNFDLVILKIRYRNEFPPTHLVLCFNIKMEAFALSSHTHERGISH
jgi:hypothetical protein